MKTKMNQQSEPPAVAGGLTRNTTNAGNANLSNPDPQPPATAGGSDIAQLAAENERLKTTIRLNAAHRQITGELARAGARSPELLFDAVKDELKFAADGKLENAASIIAHVTARFPEQFGSETPASIDGGAGIGGGITLTKEALAKMKPAEIAKLEWAEVRRVLAS